MHLGDVIRSTSKPNSKAGCDFALERLEFAKDKAAQYEFLSSRCKPCHLPPISVNFKPFVCMQISHGNHVQS